MRELHVDSINKWFGTVQILSDVFISCKRGDLIGLLGRNGCGKSTLLKIIFGSVRAETKFVSVDETPLHTLREIRNKISYLPQNNFLPTHLKIKKVVDLFCEPSQAHSLKDNQHVRPFLHRRSPELSGGERRIIEILLILQAEREYVLIDEPFNGVEPRFRDEIKNIIREHSKAKGIIVTDHDYRNIMAISTKLLLLKDGSIREIKTVEELVVKNYLPDTNL
jgi:ABC-type multidrug transport system ATPase subunit